MKKMLRHIMVVMVLLLSSTTAFTQTRDSERLGMALEYFTSGKYHESLLILERLDKQYTTTPLERAIFSWSIMPRPSLGMSER